MIQFDRFPILRLYLISALIVSTIFFMKKLAEVNMHQLVAQASDECSHLFLPGAKISGQIATMVGEK